LKITFEEEHPYALALSLGISFVVVGALLGLWVIRMSRSQRSIGRMKAGDSAK
jgi:hypothetical protein